MNKTVFYSWQSDDVIPNNVNRSFIETALKKAAKAIAKDDTVEIDPRVDRDTTGVAGSPPIPQTILDKIDSCDAFVCDVTIVNPNARKSRRMPNPNVMFELGYALKRLGWERIVMVMNTAYGSQKDLPFDLEKRRVLGYEARTTDADLAGLRQDLQHRFEGQMRAILSLEPATNTLVEDTPTIQERMKTLKERERFNQYRKKWRLDREGVDECRAAAKGTIEAVRGIFSGLSEDMTSLGIELKSWEEGTSQHLTLNYKFLVTVHAVWTQQWANSVDACGWEIKTTDQKYYLKSPGGEQRVPFPESKTMRLAADLSEDGTIIWFVPEKRFEAEFTSEQVAEKVLSDFMERVERRIHSDSTSTSP